MGGKASKNTRVNSNRIALSNKNLDGSLEKFWKIDSFGTLKNDNPALLPRNEQKALNILQKTVKRIDSHYSVGLFCKEESPSLPNNRNLALSRLLSLEKKFKNNPNFHANYKKTINEYIAKGDASKIVGEDLQKHTSKIVNFIPHHGVTNVNKHIKSKPFEETRSSKEFSWNPHSFSCWSFCCYRRYRTDVSPDIGQKRTS